MISWGTLALLLPSLPDAAAAPEGAVSVTPAAANIAGPTGAAQTPVVEAPPRADSRWPQLLGAQYTFVEQ